jgi:hypothetical protein
VVVEDNKSEEVVGGKRAVDEASNETATEEDANEVSPTKKACVEAASEGVVSEEATA